MTAGQENEKPAAPAGRTYCRAYPLARLRRFADWTEAAGTERPADDTVVYLWDDLTVVTDPLASAQSVLWDRGGAHWERFCREELNFEIPEDLER
ncbi:hypothetical protein [Streptomyces sp. NPDC058683]|uniref:hypothetical protein n=1 Tax=Streptomyces sp. NPDC058683 TaxID=3346597 RepID=UPI0036524DDE